MSLLWINLLLSAYFGCTFVSSHNSKLRNFTINYEIDAFVKDGKPFRYISGSIHYARVPYQYWEDRLAKMAAAGLDAVQVYIPWNIHEPEPGVYNFKGQNDVIGFLELAASHNLLVILRPGPYICGEWDYGGFPYWLKMDNDSIVLRSMDPGYISPVRRWFNVLLPLLKPLLYSNGGPIILVQVENEYGSYASVDCGHDYMAFLRDLLRGYLGDDIQLFTTDGAGTGYLKCGAIDGVYATVDFGPGDAASYFQPMRAWNPTGPLVNSEYYTGWLDYWNGTWAYIGTAVVVQTLQDMLNMGANVNMYMFEGGTNFGFMNGADPLYQPVVTSYDYDAPMTELGDITHKYMAIRELISKYKIVPALVPKNTSKAAYGTVKMNKVVSVYEAMEGRSMDAARTSKYPITMEQAKQAYGFAVYRKILRTAPQNVTLSIPGIRDRGYVTLDGVPQGVLYRNTQTSLDLLNKSGHILDILVENMGRIGYGAQINDNKKGIISDVTLGNETLTNWTYYSLNISEISKRSASVLKYSKFSDKTKHLEAPAFYEGTFTLGPQDIPADTFLNVCGWTKGVALINGFNLGRYWPVNGPQVTLFIPKSVIKLFPAVNVIRLLELERSPCGYTRRNNGGRMSQNLTCTIELVPQPVLGAKCTQQGALVKLPRRNVKNVRYRRLMNDV